MLKPTIVLEKLKIFINQQCNGKIPLFFFFSPSHLSDKTKLWSVQKIHLSEARIIKIFCNSIVNIDFTSQI